MIDKICSINKLKEFIKDGYSIMVGGFGVPGTPFILIDAVLNSGKKELTLIKNEANEEGMGISRQIEAGVVKKLITTHIGLNRRAIEMMNSGKIEVDFYPMGILAEKIRAGGSGILGFLTDIGIDTILRKGKQIIELNGREMFIEQALRSDIALIHASRADRFGNLIYEKSARNFNPIMATAANKVIVEVENIVEIGELDPDQIHTPGVFVHHIVVLEKLTEEYEILGHHVTGK